MTLHVFAGSLLPYIEGLDSWLFEGILDDPFEEVTLVFYFLFGAPNRKKINSVISHGALNSH